MNTLNRVPAGIWMVGRRLTFPRNISVATRLSSVATLPAMTSPGVG